MLGNLGGMSDFAPVITTNAVSGTELSMVATPSSDNPHELALAVKDEDGEAQEDEEGAGSTKEGLACW